MCYKGLISIPNEGLSQGTIGSPLAPSQNASQSSHDTVGASRVANIMLADSRYGYHTRCLKLTSKKIDMYVGGYIYICIHICICNIYIYMYILCIYIYMCTYYGVDVLSLYDPWGGGGTVPPSSTRRQDSYLVCLQHRVILKKNKPSEPRV